MKEQNGRKYNSKNPFVYPIILIIKFYQLVFSPLLGVNCRFYPSCSEYSIECLSELGFLRGSFMIIKRILRCHPLGGSGYDPLKINTDYQIKEVNSETIRLLREKTLYENLPKKLSKYSTDDNKDCWHFICCKDKKVVSAITIIGDNDVDKKKSAQIRGMFTLTSEQRKGYGSILLKFSIKFLKNLGYKIVWCNSRKNALCFYKNHGFVESGKAFVIKYIGLHYKLALEII